MKNNIFGIDLTVFSGDISIHDALVSLADQYEPWVRTVKDKLKNGEPINLIAESDNYCSGRFVREWVYMPDEDGEYDFFVIASIQESQDDGFNLSKFNDSGILSIYYYIFVDELEYRLKDGMNMFSQISEN